jgi:hypothetical protein
MSCSITDNVRQEAKGHVDPTQQVNEKLKLEATFFFTIVLVVHHFNLIV